MSKELFNKIISKLQRLDEYIKYLVEIKKVNKNSFINDFHFFGLAEHYLQISIEAILDIAKLLIISQGYRKPEDNNDILNVLIEEKVLKEKTGTKLTGIAKFRNLLVHEYEKIDHDIVFEKLQKKLDDLRAFKKEVNAFLKKTVY